MRLDLTKIVEEANVTWILNKFDLCEEEIVVILNH